MNTETKDQSERISQTLAAIRAFSLNISANLGKIAELRKIERETPISDVLDVIALKLKIYADIIPDVMKLRLCAVSILAVIDTENRETITATLSETQKVAERFFTFAEICRDFAIDIGSALTEIHEHD